MDSIGEAEKKKSVGGFRDAEHGVWHGETEVAFSRKSVSRLRWGVKRGLWS